MKSATTIVMTDPAESSDPTGIIGIHGNFETQKIHVKLAKQFKDKDKNLRLSNTANFLIAIKKTIHPDFMGAETNNDGVEIIKKLKRLGISLYGISTSANLTDETRTKGISMDKPFMIDWFKKQKEKHNILFSSEPSQDMQECIDQISEIAEIKTPGGKSSHKRLRGRHDDLFMALLLCCHVFLVLYQKWEELQ